MKHLLLPLLTLMILPPALLAAAPRDTAEKADSSSVIQECRRAGQKMLEHQLGKVGELALTGTSSQNPQVHSLRNQTFIDGIGTIGSSQGTHEFSFRCIRNQGSGKTEFTYNNMQFHSPLGTGVIDPSSAAGAQRARTE